MKSIYKNKTMTHFFGNIQCVIKEEVITVNYMGNCYVSTYFSKKNLQIIMNKIAQCYNLFNVEKHLKKINKILN